MQSSPEGITLNKGSKLVSLDLKVNNKTILTTNKPKQYSHEFVERLLEKAIRDHINLSPSQQPYNCEEEDSMIQHWISKELS